MEAAFTKIQINVRAKRPRQIAIRSYAVAASVAFIFALGFLFFQLNKTSDSERAIFSTAKTKLKNSASGW